MKKTKIMSAFLSLTLGMTSMAGVPLNANAVSVDPPTVTEENKGVSLTTTSAPIMTTNTSTSTPHVTTAPPSANPYDKPVECAVNVCIRVRDYDTGKTIDNVDVKVVKGYEGVEEVCSFNTNKYPEFDYKFEYSINSSDDKGVYQIILENLPEYYNFTNNTTSWMMYLDEAKAKQYEGKVYNYNLDIHPIVSDVQGTVTGITTTSLVTHDTTTRPRTTTTASAATEDVTKKKSSISFEKKEYNLAAGSQYILKLNNPDGIKMDYKVKDDYIADERIIYPTYVYVFASIPGKTKITAIGSNGETAEAVINVFEPEIVTTGTTTGTGTVTTTVTETTYVRSTPSAGMRFVDDSDMYIRPNEVKVFNFEAWAASGVEFKSDSPDVKIGNVKYEGRGLTNAYGTVEISCRYDAEPHGILLYSYTKHFMTGEYFKSPISLMIVDDSFTPTTTSNPNGTTSSITTYVTIDTGTGSGEKSETTAKVSNTGTKTSTTLPITTTISPSTTIIADYLTATEYDLKPMRVGDTRKIRFYHPQTKKSETPSISCSGTNVSYTYNDGDDFITIKALKEGKAELNIREKTCAFGDTVRFDIFAADADIITDVIAPDKLVYGKGEELDISGLQGIVEHADGTTGTIDLSKISSDELTVEELYTAKDFPTMKENRYNVRIGSRDQTEITVGGKKYGISKGYRGTYATPTSWFVYIGENKYVQLKNVKVINCNMGTKADGLEFKGIDTKFSYDMDAYMYVDRKMATLNVGDIVSGVLEVNGNYVITGDVETVWYGGDANCDGEVNMGDAVLIMQAIANPDKYGEKGTDKNHITAQGRDNADTTDDGMTNLDALAVQKKLLFLK